MFSIQFFLRSIFYVAVAVSSINPSAHAVVADCSVLADVRRDLTPESRPDVKTIIIEGAGDVVLRHRLPAWIEIKQENPDLKFNLYIADSDFPDETADMKERKNRIRELAAQNGFIFLNKSNPKDKAIYDALKNSPRVTVDVAKPGWLHAELIDSWLGDPSFAGDVIVEKPMGGSLEELRTFALQYDPFSTRLSGLDHYLPKVGRSQAAVEKDIKFLKSGGGTGVSHFEFIMTENRSGSDPEAALFLPSKRDGAIEREGRNGALRDGIAADFLPHLIAILDYYGKASTIVKTAEKAGRYTGVDGDPNKPAQIDGETYYSAQFRFKNNGGGNASGSLIVGKGVRTSSYGKEFENETKFLYLYNEARTRRIVFNFRNKGTNALSVRRESLSPDTKKWDVKSEESMATSFPYKPIILAILKGTNPQSSTYVFNLARGIEIREALEKLTPPRNQITLFPGGMAAADGRPERLAPTVEELEKTLPNIGQIRVTQRLNARAAAEEAKRTSKQFSYYLLSKDAASSKLQTSETPDRTFAIVGGAGAMGTGFTYQLAKAGEKIVVAELNPEQKIAPLHESLGTFSDRVVLSKDTLSAIRSLQRPRKVMMIIPNNNRSLMAKIIREIAGYLEPGDIFINACNDPWNETQAFQAELGAKGIKLVGMGVSGGTKGAREGSSMMVGTDEATWEQVRPLLEKMAAEIPSVEDPSKTVPSVRLIGPGGAGHFAKMVHNGIEYALMQIYAEAYAFLKSLGLRAPEIADFLERVAKEEPLIDSFLFRKTIDVLRMKNQNDEPIINKILPLIEEKGTGRATVEAATRFKVAIPLISAAVNQRFVTQQTALLKKVVGSSLNRVDLENDIHNLKSALLLAQIMAYVEGFEVLKAASSEVFENKISLQNAVQVWRRGSILEGSFLELLAQLYQNSQSNLSLWEIPEIEKMLLDRVVGTARAIQVSVAYRLPMPAVYAAYSYFENYRTGGVRTGAELPALLRHAFGDHEVTLRTGERGRLDPKTGQIRKE